MKRLATILIILCISVSASADEIYRVARVVDGDTLILEQRRRTIKVRLIGIDTPEMHDSDKLVEDAERSGEDIRTVKDLGKRSSQFASKLVKNRMVRLEYGGERHDRHGRTLAYVFFRMTDKEFADKTGQRFPKRQAPEVREYLLNRAMVEYGYAFAYTKFPFTYRKEFIRLQGKAREQGLGLWGRDGRGRDMRRLSAGE